MKQTAIDAFLAPKGLDPARLEALRAKSAEAGFPYLRVTTNEGDWLVDPPAAPVLTSLNFSGGKQSSAILWMLIREEGRRPRASSLPRPKELIVLNADPGMENSHTYDYVRAMFERCRESGIDARVVDGPKLYDDLVQLRASGRSRIDNPPYWTKDRATGKQGKLQQKCTQEYKVRPMDRELRRVMQERFQISPTSSALGFATVEKWIGFGYDELPRIKAPPQKYIRFAYPLIELKMSRGDVEKYFADRKLPAPPRSVCNGCFANGLRTFKEMYEQRPDDWAQAVAVDEAVRDLRAVGIEQEAYVSKTLVPLRELPDRGFMLSGADGDEDGWSCDSGYCFT